MAHRNIRQLFVLTLLLVMSVFASAQTQQGFVKTLGRPGRPGVPLSNVTIRMRGVVNAVLSGSDGRFSILMTGKKKGDAIILQSIQKNGYELADPNLIGRQQVFSPDVPIEIVMVSSRELEENKRRIEKKAYERAERTYQSKVRELNQQINEQQITAQQYREQLQQLQDQYEKYQLLIGDMADRYARADYDHMDAIDQEINMCIENGELDRADSLIHTVFDPETVLERNRAAKEEILQRIAFAQSIIDKANADKEAIMRDMDYAKRVVTLCDNLANEYISQGETSLAIECLNKSLEIERILYGDDSNEVEETIQRINALKQ